MVAGLQLAVWQWRVASRLVNGRGEQNRGWQAVHIGPQTRQQSTTGDKSIGR